MGGQVYPMLQSGMIALPQCVLYCLFRKQSWEWSCGSELKSACCASREPEFGS